MMMNFKKTALALIALSIGSIANADQYGPPTFDTTPTTKNGFYVGIGAGAMDLITDYSGAGTTVTTNRGATRTHSTSENTGKLGADATMEVGYAWYFPNRFFFGTEVFGDITSVTTSTSSTGTTTIAGQAETATVDGQLQLKYTYGLRILPGYQLTKDAVAYGIIGYSAADTDYTTNASVSGASSGSLPEGSLTKTFSGYQVGLGSMINVTENVAIRGDMIYSGYTSETFTKTGSNANGSATTSIDVKPSTLEANVGVVYMFDK